MVNSTLHELLTEFKFYTKIILIKIRLQRLLCKHLFAVIESLSVFHFSSLKIKVSTSLVDQISLMLFERLGPLEHNVDALNETVNELRTDIRRLENTTVLCRRCHHFETNTIETIENETNTGIYVNTLGHSNLLFEESQRTNAQGLLDANNHANADLDTSDKQRVGVMESPYIAMTSSGLTTDFSELTSMECTPKQDRTELKEGINIFVEHKLIRHRQGSAPQITGSVKLNDENCKSQRRSKRVDLATGLIHSQSKSLKTKEEIELQQNTRHHVSNNVNTDVKASGLTSESKAGLGEEHINTRSQDTYVETIESKNKRDVCKGSFNAHKTENILGKKEKEDRLLGDNPTNVSPLDRSDSLPLLGGDTSKLWTSSRTKHGYSRGVYHTASKGKTKSTLPENHKLINTDDFCLLSDKQRINLETNRSEKTDASSPSGVGEKIRHFVTRYQRSKKRSNTLPRVSDCYKPDTNTSILSGKNKFKHQGGAKNNNIDKVDSDHKVKVGPCKGHTDVGTTVLQIDKHVKVESDHKVKTGPRRSDDDIGTTVLHTDKNAKIAPDHTLKIGPGKRDDDIATTVLHADKDVKVEPDRKMKMDPGKSDDGIATTVLPLKCALCNIMLGVDIKHLTDLLWSEGLLSDNLYNRVTFSDAMVGEENILWTELIAAINNLEEHSALKAIEVIVKCLEEKHTVLAPELKRLYSFHGNKIRCLCKPKRFTILSLSSNM